MKIFVRLYAPFLEFLPLSHDNGMVTINMRQGNCAGDVLVKLGIPSNSPKLIRVDGKLVSEDFMLKEGHVVELIPPLAGG